MGYTFLHSAIDDCSRLAYTEPLEDEKGTTAATVGEVFNVALHRKADAPAWFGGGLLWSWCEPAWSWVRVGVLRLATGSG